MPPLDAAGGLAAAAPVVLLLVLVLWGRWGAVVPAASSLLLCVVLAVSVFGAGLPLVAVAVGKGIWLAGWILLVVWPALLLFRIASVAGLDRLGDLFTSILPRRRQNLLVVAWVFPSFIQGVAGFGTPIAVTAPLLLAMGWGPVRAIAYPLIGYHWSVTFGSMGSSFYMASLTAGFHTVERAQLALTASGMLAVNCLVAGALVLVLDGGLRGLREGGGVLLAVGLPMAATLVAVATLVPAVATLAAGTTGFLVILALNLLYRRRNTAVPATVLAGVAHGTREQGEASATGDSGATAPTPGPGPFLLLAPYLYLLVVALPVFVVPASRAWVQRNASLAFDFPATATSLGWKNAAVVDYSPIAVLAHPGTYISLACLLGFLTFRARGLWRGPGSNGLLVDWLRGLPKASWSILLLACLATVLVDAGMVSVLAAGSAEVAGQVYPGLAPLLGALGSFMTGSTTSSNALLSSFQAQVAELVGASEVWLVAAQTAGGNVGNSLAPVVVLVGVGATAAQQAFAPALRYCLLPATLLLMLVSVMAAVGSAVT